MRILVDNALSVRVAEGLRNIGHDVVHVRDIGMAAASDPDILALARQEDRVLISADTDFGVLLSITRHTKPSFVLLRRADRRPAAVLKVLLDNLPQIQADVDAGCVVVIEDSRIRVRRLPL